MGLIRTRAVLERLGAWLAGLSLSLLIASAATAQTGLSGAGGLDIDPPLIEHDVVESAEPATRQGFFATVVDDLELAAVTLFYRRAGDVSYLSQPMRAVANSSTHIAQVSTEPGDLRAIEYYIVARDSGGNRTLRGYSFSPLIRTLRAPNTPPSRPLEGVSEAAPQAEARQDRRGLYWLLGALALGVVVGVAGSGGGGGGGGEAVPGCSAGNCPLSFTINPPELE